MFRDVRNKKFTDVVTNNVVVVNSQVEDIATLSNGQKINVNRLLNPMYFDEYIDPNDFFNKNTLNIFAEKIKSIPNEIIDKLPENDSAIIANYDIEEEKRMIAEKYNLQNNNNNKGQISAQRQLDLLKSIVGEEEYSNDELTRIINPNISSQNNIVNNQHQEEPIIRINVEDSEDVKQEIVTTQVKNKQEIKSEVIQSTTVITKDDPITSMFKNVKKNTDFSFTLEINEKIPRLDFLEMMEDSYEVSIIDYLASEFTKKIISDPSFIKDKIANKIRLLVEEKDKVKKSSKIEEKVEDILPKKTTQVVKKSTRKPKIEEKNNI